LHADACRGPKDGTVPEEFNELDRYLTGEIRPSGELAT
jgi:hypothetical protein